MCTVIGSHNPLEFELIWLTKSVCKNMQFPLIDLYYSDTHLVINAI